MFAGQVGQAHALDHELIALVSDVRLAWQALGCGNVVHLGAAAGASGAVEGAVGSVLALGPGEAGHSFKV